MAKQKVEKTNAMRLLDTRGVAYEPLVYDLGIHSAEEVAGVLGVPPEQVYKTLVVLRDPPSGRPLLVMVAGGREIDLRRLARSLGEKAVRMAPHREAERLTGLQVGGIGALALVGKHFEPCLDRPALEHEWLLVNGGRRGLNLRLAVADLVRVTGARIVDATEPPGSIGEAQGGTADPPAILRFGTLDALARTRYCAERGQRDGPGGGGA